MHTKLARPSFGVPGASVRERIILARARQRQRLVERPARKAEIPIGGTLIEHLGAPRSIACGGLRWRSGSRR